MNAGLIGVISVLTNLLTQSQLALGSLVHDKKLIERL